MESNLAPSPKKLLPRSPKCEIIEELQGVCVGEYHGLVKLTPLSVKQWPIRIDDGVQGDESWPAKKSGVWRMDRDSGYTPHTLPATLNSGREEYTCSLCFQRFDRVKAMHGHMRVHGGKRKATSQMSLHTKEAFDEIGMAALKKARAVVASTIMKDTTSEYRKDMNATAIVTSYKNSALEFIADAGYMTSTAAPKGSARKHICDICGEDCTTGQALGGHKGNHYTRPPNSKERPPNRKECRRPISTNDSIDMVLTREKQQKPRTKTLCTNESAVTIPALMESPFDLMTHPKRAPAPACSAVRSIRLFGFDIIVCPEAE